MAENQKKIVKLILKKPSVTIKEMAEAIGISTTAIDKNLNKLKEKEIIRRVGGDKGGSWEFVEK